VSYILEQRWLVGAAQTCQACMLERCSQLGTQSQAVACTPEMLPNKPWVATSGCMAQQKQEGH